MSECLHEDCENETPHPRNVFCSHSCRKNHTYYVGRNLTNDAYHLTTDCSTMGRYKKEHTATWNKIKYHNLHLCPACNPLVVREGNDWAVVL